MRVLAGCQAKLSCFVCFRESGALPDLRSLFCTLPFLFSITSLSDDVRYYVSTFIDYTFRKFAVIFIV